MSNSNPRFNKHEGVLPRRPETAPSADLLLARQDAHAAGSAVAPGRAGACRARPGLRRAGAGRPRQRRARGGAHARLPALPAERPRRLEETARGLGRRGRLQRLRARTQRAARRAGAGRALPGRRQLPGGAAHLALGLLVGAVRHRRRRPHRGRRPPRLRHLPPARPPCAPRRGRRLLLPEQCRHRRATPARHLRPRRHPGHRHAPRPGHPGHLLRAQRRAVCVDPRRPREFLSRGGRFRGRARRGRRLRLQPQPADAARFARVGVLRPPARGARRDRAIPA
ncbi:Uncharacterised protein [Achromobacter sp. 2789STDY5608615]|nr:Uncharacterised protein [Achromobacter sp. 2789STDY5608615]